MKLNLGMGSGSASGPSDASKNYEIIFEDADCRVMRSKVGAYWRFFVYCYKRLPFPDPEHPDHDRKRFGREFFNQQDAQRNFAAMKTTTNIIKLPNK